MQIIVDRNEKRWYDEFCKKVAGIALSVWLFTERYTGIAFRKSNKWHICTIKKNFGAVTDSKGEYDDDKEGKLYE